VHVRNPVGFQKLDSVQVGKEVLAGHVDESRRQRDGEKGWRGGMERRDGDEERRRVTERR
jgi:hypothetical protein